MKKILSVLIILCLLLMPGCSTGEAPAPVVATTRAVYDLTALLCRSTGITVDLLITENLSCLHDYTLQVRQMRAVEGAEVVIVSGAGLEDFFSDALADTDFVIDASSGIPLLCHDHDHGHGDHHHEEDPHIWLSVSNARIMADNICQGLIEKYPQYRDVFIANLGKVLSDLDALDSYGKQAFSSLKSRDLITFHDGFAYFAQYWDLNILHSLEEESGSEASASELKELIRLVRDCGIPAIFTEENGSASAAGIIAAETGISVYALNMGMSDMGYFEAMYHNINTIKEALG